LKLEIQQLESEYSNYKQKAQTMLKAQRPTTEVVQETDEIENLQRLVQDFHSETSLLKYEKKNSVRNFMHVFSSD